MHAILQQHNLRPATQPSSTRSGRPAASSIPAPVPSAAQFIRQSTPAANRQLSQINHRHPMPPPPAAAAAPATAAGSLASQVQSILVDESRRAMTASSSSVSRTNVRQSTEGRLFPFSTIDDILQPARSAQSANSVAAMALWSSRLSSATTDRDGAAIPTMAEGEEGGLFGQSTSSPGGRSLHHRIAEELARLVRLPTTTAQTPIENLHASSSLATSSWNKSADHHHQHPYARPPTEGSASRPPIAGGGGASLLSSMVHSPPPLRVLPVQPSSTLFNSSPGGRQHAGGGGGGGGGGGHASKSQHPSGSIDVAGCTTPDAASSVSVLLSVLESAPNEQLLAIVKAVVVRLLDRCAAVTKSSDVARASSSRRNTRTHASIAKPSDVLDQLCSIYAEATGAVAGNEAVPPSQDQRDEEEGLPNSAQEQQQQQQQPSASASAQPVRSATASVVCPDEDPVDDVSWQASPPRRLQRRVNSHPSSNAAAGEGAAGSGNSLLGKWSDTATFENGPSRSSTMQYKASSVYSSGSGSGTVTRNEEDETYRYQSAGGGGGNPEFVLQRQILILRREREEAKQEVAQLQRELHRMASEAEPSLY